MSRGIPNSDTERVPAPPLTRVEAHARIVRALAKLEHDEDRRAVLASLASLYGAGP